MAWMIENLKKKIRHVQLIQIAAARALWKEYLNTLVLQSLHWLTGSQRIDFKISLVYKALNSFCPKYILDFGFQTG